ncbi:MAG TPA: ABC transporter ATP-binding protein [Solirubrobacteraceae bacterium]|jgi:ATP-binding cassette subfamily B protein
MRRKNPSLPRLVRASVRIAWEAGRREMTLLAVMQVATVGLVIASLLVAREVATGIVDADDSGASVGSLLPEVLALAFLTAALGIANAVQVQAQRLLAELCTRRGEDHVLAVATGVDLAAYDEPGFHDAIERALGAVRRLPAVVTNLANLLRALAGALGALVGLAALEPLFAPAVLLVGVPTWFAARRRATALYRFAYKLTPRDRERVYLSGLLADRDAAKEVRAFDVAGFLDARRDRLWDERIDGLRAVTRRQLAYSVLADVLAAAIISGSLIALIALSLSDEIDLGTTAVTALAIVMLGQRVTLASASSGGLSESALFMDDYLALVEREERPARAERPPGPAPPAALAVRADGVWFSYAGARGHALRDVSLAIEPGEVVALVGENGSGKTTLAKLLAGLYAPERGRVTWNGVDTTDPARAELGRAVAVIFQDFVRYALPAAENIGLGHPGRLPDDDGIREAARAAGAHADLDRLPDGYDTVLGPAFAGGTDLSLGQWQRVALARALFRDAPFVVLDEPTAALDAQAEHDLFAGIRELLRGRSVLLISHRFSTVREADRIHVMHAGAIVESGTHDELMARGERYARLFALQATPYR